MKYEQTNYDNNYISNERTYTTRRPLSHYIIRFLIGLILLALLLFLLMSIFPTKSGIKNTIENAINNALGTTLEEKLDAKLNPITDRIFGDNILNIKDAAKDYFTTERMPKQEGDSIKLTLGEMLDKKLITPVKDKDGKMCDTEKSYVQVTKVGNEYKMKVNLSCGSEEDYIVTYLGCYNYCQGDICESKKTEKAVEKYVAPKTNTVTKTNTITKTVTKIVNKDKHVCVQYNGKYYDKNGNVTTKDGYTKSCVPKVEEKHYCVLYNGKYYDKAGNVVTKAKYEDSCVPKVEEKHYCVIYGGKYYDKNGNVVTKAKYEDSCVPKVEEKHYCVIFNGKYYDKNGNVVTKAKYEDSCVPKVEEKHYCVLYNGKYYDKNGNVTTKDGYTKSCVPAVEKYRYLYRKTITTKTATEYSKWTDWSENKVYNPDNNNITWGQQELVWNEKVGYKVTKSTSYVEDRTQPIYNTTYDKLLGYKKQYVCDGYNYYVDGTTNTTYTSSGWSKVDRVTLTYMPTQTDTKRYVYVGMDFDRCDDTCTLKPYYIFDVYTRSTSKATTYNNVNVTATCKIVEKQVPIYGKNIVFAGYVTNKVTTEKKTYYYHTKTRTITKKASTKTTTDEKWSYSANDTTLINQGYKYTGTKEKVQG